LSGSVALPYLQNYNFKGMDGTDDPRKEDLIPIYADPNNYEGSNELRYGIAALEDRSAAKTAFGGSLLDGNTATILLLATAVYGWGLREYS